MRTIFGTVATLAAATTVADAQAPRDLPPTGILSVGGCELRYSIEGKGATTVVIGSAQVYSRMFSRALREHLRLVFLDERTFAARCDVAASDTGTVTLDTFTDEIEAALARLVTGRVILIGHSQHGAIAVAFARKYPQRVSHVVVIGNAPFNAAADEGMANWNAHASTERKAAYAAAQARLDSIERVAPLPQDLAFIRRYAFQGAMRWYDWGYDQLPFWEGVRVNLPLVIRQAQVSEGVIAAAVPSLGTPLLVVMGAHDYPVPWRNWDALGELPHVTRHVLQKSGHNPMTEEPEAFDRLLVDWIRHTSSGAG